MKHKVSIPIGNACNSDCLFCMAREQRKYATPSFEKIVAAVFASKGKGREVELSGGEFLLRRDALSIILSCRRAGFKGVSFGTNGAMLANPDFARAVVKARADNINFSLHGFRPETHDAITRRPGSHAMLLKGINNVISAGTEHVRIIFVITKQNCRELASVSKRFAGMKAVDNIAFNFVRPMEYFSPEEYRAIVPRMTDIVPFLREAAAFPKTRFRYIPPCIFEKTGRQASSAALEIYDAPKSKHSNMFKYLSENMVHGKPCRECSKIRTCPGIWKTYRAVYGDSELRPFR